MSLFDHTTRRFFPTPLTRLSDAGMFSGARG